MLACCLRQAWTSLGHMLHAGYLCVVVPLTSYLLTMRIVTAPLVMRCVALSGPPDMHGKADRSLDLSSRGQSPEVFQARYMLEKDHRRLIP